MIQESLQEIGKVEPCCLGYEVQHTGCEHIDAHAHQVGAIRFLPKFEDLPVASGLDHAEVHRFCPARHSHCRSRGLFVVEANDLPEIDVGQQVAVEDEDATRCARQACQRACGAQWGGFVGIAQLQAEFLAILEIGLNQPREVPDRKGDILESVGGQLPKQYLQNRIIPDRHEWFRKRRRVGKQSGPLATGKNDNRRLLTERGHG